MLEGTKKPPTAIHNPLAKAVIANDTTKFGKTLAMNVVIDSAATKSRIATLNNTRTHLLFDES